MTTRPDRSVPFSFALSLMLLSGCVQTSTEVAQSGLADFSSSVFVNGLSSPTAMAFAPDGRLFVCEQGGRLRVVDGGVLLGTPFVTLSVDAQGERGLLGVTFDPDFSVTPYVYVYYTATAPQRHNRVSRFLADGNVARANSEQVLLELDPLSNATNHNGGAISFGTDGKLYIGVGDNANGANAQTTANLLGKVLRIESDGTIPADNPFYGTAAGVNRAIWSLGLRNPFTFAIEARTGRILIGDVGQGSWEEIDDGAAGANYGWPDTEGATTDARFQGPLYAYGHSGTSPSGCAITGGTFYEPSNATFPASYLGTYFFADYCGGWIWRLDPSSGALLGEFVRGLSSPVDLDVGPDGSLYYLARGSGSVGKVSYSAGQAPQIVSDPVDQMVAEGQPATFSVSASGSGPLGYQWQQNGSDLPGETSAELVVDTSMSDDGATFRCVVTNAFGSATSASATLTVRTMNSAPSATITSPADGTRYSVGDTIAYEGVGNDAEDGALPGSAFTWMVELHHDEHVHPFLLPTTGSVSGSFVIPADTETMGTVFYRITLRVEDSSGLVSTATRDIRPRRCGAGQFEAEYYANRSLAGAPTFTRCEAPIAFQWGKGGPSNRLKDNFSVRWTGLFEFPGGTSTIVATADDGIRVRVDGNLVINQWSDHTATTYSASVSLTSGSHEVQVEYYEHRNRAIAVVSW